MKLNLFSLSFFFVLFALPAKTDSLSDKAIALPDITPQDTLINSFEEDPIPLSKEKSLSVELEPKESTPQNQEESLLDEAALYTHDQKCAIHYLTKKNTTGWKISTLKTNCPDQWIDGYADVTIVDAFGKPVEQIYGFFKQGYWTGKIKIETPITGRFNPEQGIQSLSFDLGQDSERKIHFRGQMRSTRISETGYSSFKACDPARILAIAEDPLIFEDETQQQDLINSVIKRAQSICPDTKLIYFFGTKTEQPTKDQIDFFADIDLDKKQIHVRRLPSSPRMTEKQIAALAQSKAPLPKVIRKEQGTSLMKVTPLLPTKTSTVKSSILPHEDVSSPQLDTPPQPEKLIANLTHRIDLSTQKNEADTASIALLQDQPPSDPIETAIKKESIQRDFALNQDISKSQQEQTLSTSKNKEPSQGPKPEKAATPTPKPFVPDEAYHLLTASRLLKQPVSGIVAVHVRRADLSGVSWIDLPLSMQATGRLLPIGWNIVKGSFTATPSNVQTQQPLVDGVIQIKASSPCLNPECVPNVEEEK